MGSVKRLDSYYTVSDLNKLLKVTVHLKMTSVIDFSQISPSLQCGNCRFNKIRV